MAQYAKRGRDVVVSRKSYIEAEAKEQRKASLGKLEIGAVVKGIVRSVVQYGAFIAIPSADDVEGLVHMTEASHDRNAKLTDVFRPGEEIDVKVLRVDDKGKLWLSHRAAVLDPWQEAMKTSLTQGRCVFVNQKTLPFAPINGTVEVDNCPLCWGRVLPLPAAIDTNRPRLRSRFVHTHPSKEATHIS